MKFYILFALFIFNIPRIFSEQETKENTEEIDDGIIYATPKPPTCSYIAETFDNPVEFNKAWIRSEAKKDTQEADIAKYDGEWKVEEPATPILKGDRGLVLKSKAKHAAISAPLSRPFKFAVKPLIVQYEVTLQEGQECGGGYIKLISFREGDAIKLNTFHDKTPYTIMFGPDNCGNDFKVHFIIRYVNPKDGSIEEKHAKVGAAKEEQFKDKKPHLYTLIVRPDNSFEIQVDHVVLKAGNLLEDMQPPINPEKEIADPEDSKPADWDENETIPDPDDKKPEDWDDDAPPKIVDEAAVKPSGWLEEEPEMIPDAEATKPDDWEDDIDGDWEAPQIPNPKCADAIGCGEWTQPKIDNPNYRGKWFPRQIPNPNYKGEWAPRMIPNPAYYEDLEPFKMTPISAVGFELWTMSANVLFDNVLVTECLADASSFAADTFDLKIAKLEKGKGSLWQQFIEYSNERPWLHAVYVLMAAIPVVLIVMCCCTSSSKDAAATAKKTDAVTPEDLPQQEAQEEEQESQEEEEEAAGSQEEGAGSQEEAAGSQEEAAGSQTETSSGGDSEQNEAAAERRSTKPRRRVRKD